MLTSETPAYPWVNHNGISFRGWFMADGIVYRGETALQFWANIKDARQLQQRLRQINGCFSLVIETAETVFLCVDRLRSFPLFYCVHHGEFLVSNTVESIRNHMQEISYDDTAMEDYRTSVLFCTGKYTMIKGVFGVQAGELLQLDRTTGDTQALFYFSHAHEDFFVGSELELKEPFEDAYRTVVRNMIAVLQGRTAVIPLSGGADSRMILKMLLNEKYDKIICYSYGKTGNSESRVSKEVADRFGCAWHMIPYTAKKWRKLETSGEIACYFTYAGNYTSLPHIQDLPAVKELKDNHSIPDDSVFIPGHSGDLIAGSHITEDFLGTGIMDRAQLLEAVTYKFYKVKQIPASLRQRISEGVSGNADFSMEDAASEAERFNIRERQAKFIVNSVRAYEFYGYEWLIPLWDNALFDFWKRVPIPLRFQRKLYFTCVNNEGLRSTNDPSTYKNIENWIRKNPVFTTIARRTARLVEYKTSPLQMNGIISFPKYLKMIAKGNETFTSNNIIAMKYLDWMENKQDHVKR